jgi:hypothetical protein
VKRIPPFPDDFRFFDERRLLSVISNSREEPSDTILACWNCKKDRFYKWGSSLRCAGCSLYYLTFPMRDTLRRGCPCGAYLLRIRQDGEQCVACGVMSEWMKCQAIRSIHLIADGSVVNFLKARLILWPDGRMKRGAALTTMGRTATV